MAKARKRQYHSGRAKLYPSLTERLVSRAVVLPNGCWMWLGPVEKNGYAKISRMTARGPRSFWVHREAYEEFLAEKIKPGYHVDHLCHFTLCINPDHLEQVPQAVNTGKRRRNAR